ncbi:MAG: hypothetical protein JOS17DRAFT_545955 [Linnemannia elongata]|nr:MAG: hypothetical protein JOS17DRAFT_545955 [Linnemannia elongata]
MTYAAFSVHPSTGRLVLLLLYYLVRNSAIMPRIQKRHLVTRHEGGHKSYDALIAVTKKRKKIGGGGRENERVRGCNNRHFMHGGVPRCCRLEYTYLHTRTPITPVFLLWLQKSAREE